MQRMSSLKTLSALLLPKGSSVSVIAGGCPGLRWNANTVRPFGTKREYKRPSSGNNLRNNDGKKQDFKDKRKTFADREWQIPPDFKQNASPRRSQPVGDRTREENHRANDRATSKQTSLRKGSPSFEGKKRDDSKPIIPQQKTISRSNRQESAPSPPPTIESRSSTVNPKETLGGTNSKEIQAAASQLETIFDVYRYAVTKLTQADLSYGHTTLNPWEDASFLILHELALPFADPITHWGKSKLLQEEKVHLLSLIHQRITTQKPMPYLVNGCYQQGEYFYVDERVLIPRSFIGEILSNKELIRISSLSSNNNVKTLKAFHGIPSSTINPTTTPTTTAPTTTLSSEIVSNDSLELGYDDYFGIITNEDKFQQSSELNNKTFISTINQKQLNINNYLFDYNKIEYVLDLCTGSGCLGILSTKFFTNIKQVDIIDISSDALEVAEYNVEMKGLNDIINIYQGDLFHALPEFFEGNDSLEGLSLPSDVNKLMKTYHQKYDLIITNPPYVTIDDMEELPKEYTYEPSVALEAGKDGLDIVTRILRESYNYLNDGGGLLCEVGQCKPALEKRFKNIFHPNSRKVHWIATEQSKDEVFYIKKEHLHPDNFQ